MSSNAPPVSYPVGRSHFYLAVILVLWLIALVCALAWLRQSAGAGGSAWLMTGLQPFVGGVLLWDWYAGPKGALHWDGRTWMWAETNDLPVLQVSVHLDLQDVLLLSCETVTGRRLWLWAQRSSQAVRWLAFRRAVMTHTKQP